MDAPLSCFKICFTPIGTVSAEVLWTLHIRILRFLDAFLRFCGGFAVNYLKATASAADPFLFNCEQVEGGGGGHITGPEFVSEVCQYNGVSYFRSGCRVDSELMQDGFVPEALE